jgi:membrane-bound serine protease (ClpP class)
MKASMRRSFALVGSLGFLLVLASSSRANGASPSPSPQPSPVSRVIVAKIHGSIDRTVAGYLLQTVADGERTGSAVVLQVDTAGTLDQPAVALAQRIFRSSVPVIVWVGPAPAKAQGAGLLLMSAASLSAVAPGVGVGPLEPIDLVDGRQATLPEASIVEEMATAWSMSRGQPAPTFPSAPVPAQTALNDHLAQVRADSIPDLIASIDGTTVRTATGSVMLRTRIAENASQEPVSVRFTELGPVGRIAHAVASPAAIYVLLVFGFAALAFELTQPGFGFAGFAGIGLLGLAVYGLRDVPASWVGLLLLVVGVVLLSADVVLRRLGILTASGLVAFLGGSIQAFRGVAPAIRVSPVLIGALTVASLLYYGFVLTVAVQARDRLTTSQRGLVGLIGEARGELTPEGPVSVKGALWRGRSTDGPIPAGTRIRVRGVDGLVLRVEPEPGPDPGGGEPPSAQG